MEKEYNYLLEFTFDTVLKVFNNQRIPYMKKYYFYKLMNLIDTRLLQQGVDIKYPEFWYMYGPITDFGILDGLIEHGFTNRYYSDGNNVIYPSQHRMSFDIDPIHKKVVESTVQSMWNQHKYKAGDLIKAESYKQNSPYKFNTIFQDFIQVVDNCNQTFTPKEILISNSLDILLSKFPRDDFPEIEDFYLEWDDTTRLVLDLKDEKTKMKLVKVLKDKFWPTFSKGVRLKINKNIPSTKIIQWSEEYQNAIPQMYRDIEKIRESIILGECKIDIKVEEDIVKNLMHAAYYLDI